MDLNLSTVHAAQIDVDAIVIPVSKGTQSAAFEDVDVELDHYLHSLIAADGALADFANIAVIHSLGKIAAKYIILVGTGNSLHNMESDKIRQLAAIVARSVKALKALKIAVAASNSFQEIVEGIILGSYAFTVYKTDEPRSNDLQQLVFVNARFPAEARQQMEAGRIIAENVNLARNLVNEPSMAMTPTKLAEIAADIAEKLPLEAEILDEAAMKKQHMGALLAVAKGSTESPRLIVLKYIGNKASSDVLAYVGKGITFDSGGISLKPSAKMDEMKDDMAGAAAVLAAIKTIAELKLPVNILAVMPCTENMPSGTAQKPGDVITAMSGKTIEVISTDAEGRLILADAVTYAKKLGATQLVDLATLTGACLIALGDVASGIIGNDADFTAKFIAAASAVGEKAWELPHYEEYEELIKSDIADMKNSGGRLAGTITAGLFIKKFVADTPWVHVDIAGTADIAKTRGYNVKGATGVGVRTLVRLAQDSTYGQ